MHTICLLHSMQYTWTMNACGRWGGFSMNDNEIGPPSFGGFGTLLKLTCSENMADASPSLCQQLAMQSPIDWSRGCCRDFARFILCTQQTSGLNTHCETARLEMPASKYCAEELSLSLSWAEHMEHAPQVRSHGRGCVSCRGNNVSVINVSVLGEGVIAL